MTQADQDAALTTLCNRIYQTSVVEYPQFRTKFLTSPEAMGRKVVELDHLFHSLQLAISEYVDNLGQPWLWPPPTKRNDPLPEDVL